MSVRSNLHLAYRLQSPKVI